MHKLWWWPAIPIVSWLKRSTSDLWSLYRKIVWKRSCDVSHVLWQWTMFQLTSDLSYCLISLVCMVHRRWWGQGSQSDRENTCILIEHSGMCLASIWLLWQPDTAPDIPTAGLRSIKATLWDKWNCRGEAKFIPPLFSDTSGLPWARNTIWNFTHVASELHRFVSLVPGPLSGERWRRGEPGTRPGAVVIITYSRLPVVGLTVIIQPIFPNAPKKDNL